MKRILTVLALLTVCGMAFSVTGALYVRYNANNTITATEWGTTLDDLRVGRRGSGFDINTDTFGVSYKIRDAVPVGTGVANTVAGTKNASSPGYIQLTGLKIGGASADIGGAWWTTGISKAVIDTNIVSGITNSALVQNYGFNQFAFNLDFNVPLTEKISLQAYPWDKIQLTFNTGSATKNDTGVTNDGTTSMFDLVLPVHLDISGMDPISLGIFPKIHYNNTADTWNSIGSTNSQNNTDTELGLMIRLGYKINSVWGVYAHVGIDSDSKNNVGIAGAITNTETVGNLNAPIFVGLTFAPAGWVHMNIGIGYNAALASSDTIIQSTAGIAVTNKTTTGSGLQSTYGYFDEHAYQTPFLQFSGSSKFATDWELGLNTTMAMNGGAMGGNYPVVSSTSPTGYINQTQMLTFENDFNWDNNCYLKYTKDAVSFTGVFGGGTGLVGMFGFIDMSISY